jgi:hypothetical protein
MRGFPGKSQGKTGGVLDLPALGKLYSASVALLFPSVAFP